MLSVFRALSRCRHIQAGENTTAGPFDPDFRESLHTDLPP